VVVMLNVGLETQSLLFKPPPELHTHYITVTRHQVPDLRSIVIWIHNHLVQRKHHDPFRAQINKANPKRDKT
jgi:hypothetical protein